MWFIASVNVSLSSFGCISSMLIYAVSGPRLKSCLPGLLAASGNSSTSSQPSLFLLCQFSLPMQFRHCRFFWGFAPSPHCQKLPLYFIYFKVKLSAWTAFVIKYTWVE